MRKKILFVLIGIMLLSFLSGCNSADRKTKWTVDSVNRNAESDIFLSEQDAIVLENILSSEAWIDDLTDCASDVVLSGDDERQISYHSECGTFNDTKNKKYLKLDKDKTNSFNELLSKYVELGRR